MAPALTSSNPFLSTTTTTARTTKHHLHRTNKLPRSTIVCAKQDAFKFGRKSDSGDADVPAADGRPKPFFFDFNGKFPDAKSIVPVISTSSKSLFASPRRKDPNTVFVAGATGVAGARITQTLLREGFAVRAGVPDLASAQELARLAAKYKVISPEESKRLNAVEATFDDAEAIAKAIGNATKVVVTIGPVENGASAEVTTVDALEVVEAAQLAGASHIVVVYDAGGSMFSAQSTGNVLDGINAFFSNLSSMFSKGQPLTIGEFLARVAETDVNYTLIKTALADDFGPEASYGVVVAGEGSGGAAAAPDEYKVPRTKIASLVAGVLSNTSVAENKVVEVSTSPSAPSKGIEDLFSTIPEDGRRAVYREALAKAKEEEAALIASEKALEAAAAASRKPEKQASKPSKQQARAAASFTEDQASQKAEIQGGVSLEGLFSRAKDLGGEFSFDKLSSQFAAVAKLRAKVEEEESEGKTQIATIRGRAKAQKLPPQKAVVKKAAAPPPPKPKQKQQAEVKPEVRKVFGGLFQQETIYIDD